MNAATKGACFLAAIVVCTYATFHGSKSSHAGASVGDMVSWDNVITNPTRRVIEYNKGQRTYDPYEKAAVAPMREGEGFVCAGTVLWMYPERPGHEDITANHWERVKIVENTMLPDGENLRVVLGYGPMTDEPDRPRYWIPKAAFRQSLSSCPNGQ